VGTIALVAAITGLLVGSDVCGAVTSLAPPRTPDT
jgi:hypothetical protein